MDLITLSLAVKKALAELGVNTEKTQATVFQGSPVSDGGSNWIIDFAPVADKEYTVTVNGETTTQKAIFTGLEEPLGDTIVLGNALIVGGDSNGVEWTMAYIISAGATLFVWVDGSEEDGTTAITITTETETIHPIDPKYLPGVCLPVVELSSVIGDTPTALTDTETAMLKAALDNSSFAIICLSEDNFSQPILCRRLINADEGNLPYFTGAVLKYGVSAFIQDGVGYAFCGVVA